MDTARRTVKTAQEFDALMQEVDASLQDQGVPIHAREIHAMREVAIRLGVKIPLAPSRAPKPDVYEGEDLCCHISQWVQDRYGDRLKIPFVNGYSVLLLRGDAWLLKFPVIFGTMTIVCDRNLSREYPTFVANRAGQPPKRAVLNILKCIQNLPQGCANELTDRELRETLNFFRFGHELLKTLNCQCRTDELAMSALSDLNTSAKTATTTPSEYGASRWASLQAAEKFLKYYIASKNAKFPFSHDLLALSARSAKLGLPEIEGSILRAAQCNAQVRYSQQSHSLKDVVEAHKAAMRIGATVVHTLHAE